MVDTFLSIQDEIKAIAARYADSDTDMEAKRLQIELVLAPA
jgi:hypothetical protein